MRVTRVLIVTFIQFIPHDTILALVNQGTRWVSAGGLVVAGCRYYCSFCLSVSSQCLSHALFLSLRFALSLSLSLSLDLSHSLALHLPHIPARHYLLAAGPFTPLSGMQSAV